MKAGRCSGDAGLELMTGYLSIITSYSIITLNLHAYLVGLKNNNVVFIDGYIGFASGYFK